MANTRFEIQVFGDKEIGRLLRQLPRAGRKQTIERATLAGATVIADEARQRAPSESGGLRKRIRAKVSRVLPNTSVAIAGARHSHLVEFGTRGERKPKRAKAMPIDAGGETIYRGSVGPMPARPFFRPAVQAKSGAALDRVRAVIAAEVDKIIRT